MTTETREPARPTGDAGFDFLRGCGDPVMAALVHRIGPLAHAARRRVRPDDAYGSLLRSVAGQQLSKKAARTIFARLAALFGARPPTPAELIAAEERDLREAGLYRQKIAYLRDLPALHALSDDEVPQQITAVKGLGRWSADMFKSITAAYAS